MAATTLPALLDTGDHASRPAASAVGTGALYSCTDHSLIYQSDGSTWSTWATLGGGGIQQTLLDAKGDLVVASAADTAARLAVGTGNGSALVVASGETTGLAWLKHNHAASAAPAVTDDDGDGYAVGSIWIDTTNDAAYICVDASTGAAVWNPFEQAAASAAPANRILGVFDTGTEANAWITANKAIYVPIVVPEACTLYRFWYITGGTTTTAANVDIGLYNTAGTLLISTGSTAYTTANNNAFVSIDVADTALAAGLYYIGMVCSVVNGGTQFRRVGLGSNALAPLGCYVEASALPLPATATFAVPTTESVGYVCGFTTRSEIA